MCYHETLPWQKCCIHKYLNIKVLWIILFVFLIIRVRLWISSDVRDHAVHQKVRKPRTVAGTLNQMRATDGAQNISRGSDCSRLDSNPF